MDIERAKKVFPNFFKNINYKLPDGAREQNIEVYRCCLWGQIERKAFWGSYECYIKKLTYSKDITEDSDNPEHYSTSCFQKLKYAKRMMTCFSKWYPQVVLAKGITEKSCGPSQITKERRQDKTSHVDWWIYEDSMPQNYFAEVSDDELK